MASNYDKSGQHIFERRAKLLSQRITQRKQDLTKAMQAANGRIPFRTKLSQSDALQWWVKHRHDALGQQALAGLDPLSVAKLDNALNQYAQNNPAGLPDVSNANPQSGLPGEPQPNPDEVGAAMQQLQQGMM